MGLLQELEFSQHSQRK